MQTMMMGSCLLNKNKFFRAGIVYFVLVLLFCSRARANPFWIAVGSEIPSDVSKTRLLADERSLKMLGVESSDGWSVGYYEFGEPIIFRGVPSASHDLLFDRDVADIEPSIIFGHLRKATSGCAGGIPNPYPLERLMDGDVWTFGHDGTVPKRVLIDLLGSDFLTSHPPKICAFDPPVSWVDSELLMMGILKSVTEHEGDVDLGMKNFLILLRERLEPQQRLLNLFLTNGESVWVYREGKQLFYHEDPDNSVTQIASTLADLTREGGTVFPERVIGVIDPKTPIRFLLLTEGFVEK